MLTPIEEKRRQPPASLAGHQSRVALVSNKRNLSITGLDAAASLSSRPAPVSLSIEWLSFPSWQLARPLGKTYRYRQLKMRGAQ